MARSGRGATAVEEDAEEVPGWLPPGGRCFTRGDGDGVTVFVVDPGTDLRRVVWSLENYFPLPAGYVVEGRVELRVTRGQAPDKSKRS